MQGLSIGRLHLVVNPAAGRGRAARALPRLEKLLASRGVRFETSTTSGPGDAARLAARAAAEAETVVAVGGDGTVNEVVNGLRSTGARLGILPLGSGNDLIKVLGIPDDVEAALDTLLAGRERRIDLGVVNDRVFTNSIAFGIDGAVGRMMNRLRRLPGKSAYHVGVLYNVFFYRNSLIRWTIDGRGGETRANLAAVMNGTTYGGSFPIAPTAEADDGLLDVVIVGDYRIPGRIMHLPKLKKGTHLGLPRVMHARGRRITLESDAKLAVAVDGEVIEESPSSVRLSIEVIPGGLRVIGGPEPKARV